MMNRYLKINGLEAKISQQTGMPISKAKNSKKIVSLKTLEPHSSDQNMWAYEILKFYKIPQIYQAEKKSAIKIEDFIKKVKIIRIKNKFKSMIFKLKGMRKKL